jgi:aryl-alcohol dehydrogenase-like predicted oxidoreductase
MTPPPAPHRSRLPQERRLGATGLAVSPIGLGLAALGRPAYINVGHGDDLGDERSVAAMEELTHAVLDAAWDGGVRYLDAARSYGRAEDFLASWLERRGRTPDDAAIGSKWGYTYTAGWRVDVDEHEVKDHALPVLRRQWRESRERLGAHLDLYQVHSVTRDGRTLDDRPLLEALARLKDEGVRIGLSTSGPGQAEVIARAAAIEVDGVRLFDAVQATWNLLERSAGPALASAHAAGMGVIVKEALANGRLTGRNDEPGFGEAQARLRDQARRLTTTVDALALAAVLAQPWADVVLSGATTVEHLVSNLRARDVVWDDEADAALAPLVEAPEAYWRRRGALAWT